MRFIREAAQRCGMTANDLVDETTVSDRYAVTIPSGIRHRLDVEPGDKIRWRLSQSGNLTVEVVKQRYGVFSDFEPVDMGMTNAAEDHDTRVVDSR